jgi:hypothetical protein
MNRHGSFQDFAGILVIVAIVATLATGAHLAAQTGLAQLGLTETAARSFVLAEVKGPALERRNPIVIAGTRAFLKLPASARGGGYAKPGLVKGLTGVTSLAAAASTTIAILDSGRMLTWGEVRPWTRPEDGQGNLSPFPILLWLDGLQQP